MNTQISEQVWGRSGTVGGERDRISVPQPLCGIEAVHPPPDPLALVEIPTRYRGRSDVPTRGRFHRVGSNHLKHFEVVPEVEAEALGYLMCGMCKRVEND